MLDEYLKQTEVKRFLKELETNPKYLQLQVPKESVYGKHMQEELALYLFYDILWKYKLLVDDASLFDEYLSQVEKLYRKIENYNDIMHGVNKLLINLAAISLDIREIEVGEGKRKIIEHFYQKYAMDGYYIHGYSTTYEEFIKGRSFIPEKYPNHYGKMMKIQQILERYHMPAMGKDFHADAVDLTDDMIMACFYSSSSPGYFYQLLTSMGVESRLYLRQDHHAVISSLKKFMSNRSIRFSDQRTILRIVEDEWNFLTRVPKKINLLFVKRNKIMDPSYQKLYEYLDSNRSVYEIIERILSSKVSSLSMSRTLKYGEYQLVSLDDFYVKQKEEVPKEMSRELVQPKLLNSYGIVSFFLILGSLLVTLGVIVSSIMILRGM